MCPGAEDRTTVGRGAGGHESGSVRQPTAGLSEIDRLHIYRLNRYAGA